MTAAALVAWIVTALGGFVLLGRFVAGGGLQQQRNGTTRLSPGLVFGHAGLAAAGLVDWIAYTATDSGIAAWTSVLLLACVALLGFTMFARWRGAAPVPTGPGTPSATPAEQTLPPLVVYAHGLLAVATVALVLLAAAGVGSSS